MSIGKWYKDFKEMEIGKVPKEWEVVRLGDICDEIYYGITAKTTEKNTGIKMLRTTDIKNYSSDWNNLPFCEITEKRSNLDKYFLKRGDLIVARAGTVGVSVLVERDFNDTVFGSYLIKIRPKSKVNSEFLHYFFQSHTYWKHLLAAQGSTLKNINLPLLKSLKLPLPPLPEQQKIAEILSTVDSAIEKVNQAIARTERLKKGLMQELLTKGIGHKEFKDTEIGRIPKEWEVVRLKESKEIDLIMGQSPPGKSYNKKGEGLPFIQGKAEFGNMYPSPILWTTQPTKIAEEGDILISVRAPVGDVNICPYRLCIGRGLAAIRIKEGSNIFYFYWFQKEKQRIESIGKGSTFKAITKDELSNIFIPFPSLPEQQKIAEILSTVDKRLVLLRNKKEKMERIKKGLMNDLLTGKRRVKV